MRNRILGVVGIVLGAPRTLALLGGARPPSDDPAARMAWWFASGLTGLMFAAGWYYLIKGDGFPTKKKKKPKRSIRTPI